MVFKVLAENDNTEARLGEISVNGRSVRTPFLFPVVDFCCGANEEKSFGGGIYRNIKKDFLNWDRLNGTFQGVMTSISHIADFNISKKMMDYYFTKDTHSWFNYNGIVFVDSGGFKLLTEKKIKGRDFTIKDDPEEVLSYQLKFGADIVASLDHPILPTTKSNTREKRIDFSIRQAAWLIKNKPKGPLIYAVVHGHKPEILKDYFSRLFKALDKKHVNDLPDGIAIGSLVPLAARPLQLYDVVTSVKKLMKEYDIQNLPLHAFGISSTMLPVLTYLGVDTFDSGSYIQAAIHGTYYTTKLGKKNFSESPLEKLGCSCVVCRSKQYKKDMADRSEPVRTRFAPIAIHNLLMHTSEIELMKEKIQANDHMLEKYIVRRFEKNRAMAKLVENKRLGANGVV